MVDAHEYLRQQSGGHQDQAGDAEQHSEEREGPPGNRGVLEQPDVGEIREDQEARATGSEAPQAEKVGGPRPIGEEELDREQVEEDAHRAPQPVFAAAASARPMVHRHLGQRDAHPRRDRGDETMHLAVEAQPLHHLGAHRLQRAPVIVEMDPGGRGDDPVREPRGDLLRDRIATLLAPSADHVVSLVQLGDEAWDVGRIVLEVAVGGDDDLAAGVVEAGGEGGGLPEVPAQSQHPHPRVHGLEREQPLQGRIGGSVVHENDLVGLAEGDEARRQLPVQIGQVLRLVVDGDHDGDPRRHHAHAASISGEANGP